MSSLLAENLEEGTSFSCETVMRQVQRVLSIKKIITASFVGVITKIIGESKSNQLNHHCSKKVHIVTVCEPLKINQTSGKYQTSQSSSLDNWTKQPREAEDFPVRDL
ncbi:hypothetical protein PV327_011577, partial [Microctonus hyperodae]